MRPEEPQLQVRGNQMCEEWRIANVENRFPRTGDKDKV